MSYRTEQHILEEPVGFHRISDEGATTIADALQVRCSRGAQARMQDLELRDIDQVTVPIGTDDDTVTTTSGIDLVPWSVPHPLYPDEFLSFTLFDFAGQQMYYAAHQLFFTFSALYLVCFKGSDENGWLTLRFWLNSISSFHDEFAKAEDSLPSVMLVCTHKDDSRRLDSWELNGVLEEYKAEFSDRLLLTCLHYVNCKDVYSLPYRQVHLLRGYQIWFLASANGEKEACWG